MHNHMKAQENPKEIPPRKDPNQNDPIKWTQPNGPLLKYKIC